jgi:hypothetical protein
MRIHMNRPITYDATCELVIISLVIMLLYDYVIMLLCYDCNHARAINMM